MKKITLFFTICLMTISTFAQKQNQVQLPNYYDLTFWKQVRNGLPEITIQNGIKTDETEAYFTKSPVSYDNEGTIIYPYVYKKPTIPVMFIENGKITEMSPQLVSGPLSDPKTWEAMFNGEPDLLFTTLPSGSTYCWYPTPRPKGRIVRTVEVRNGEVVRYDYRLTL